MLNAVLKEVLKILKKYKLTDKNKKLLIGISGGADSVCLSEIVYNLSLKYGFKIILCHLNHNWRGEHSKSDMEFCIKFAKDRNLEIITETLSENEKQTETKARELRYKFFENCKAKTNADAILLAHNKNDRVETLIYRIIKGTGIKGLAGVKEKRENYVRPLINISRNDIEAYCQNNNLTYVTDSTNFDNEYNRNYIRNEILPQFEKINPKYMDAIYNLSVLAEEEETFLEDITKDFENKIKKNGLIETQKFINLPKPLQKRIILNIYIENNIDYDTKRINETLDFINKNKNLNCGLKMSLSKDIWIFVSTSSIEVVKKVEKSDLKINITKTGEYDFLNYTFKIEKYMGQPPEKYPKDEELKAYVEINEPLDFVLRCREDGDFIQPLGLNGTQRLKKYLNSKKIKTHQKDSLVFLCKGKEILWSPLYGLNDKIKVVSKPNYVLSLINREVC